jgi:hypothetical protein
MCDEEDHTHYISKVSESEKKYAGFARRPRARIMGVRRSLQSKEAALGISTGDEP